MVRLGVMMFNTTFIFDICIQYIYTYIKDESGIKHHNPKPNHENMSVYMVYYIQYICTCTYIKDESGDIFSWLG
jgi:hypothetical protein